jgi:phage pi2 protein 07
MMKVVKVVKMVKVVKVARMVKMVRVERGGVEYYGESGPNSMFSNFPFL